MPKSKSLLTVAVVALVVLASAACVGSKQETPNVSGNPVPSASSTESSSESASSGAPVTLDVAAVDAAPKTFVFDTKGVDSVAAGPVELTFTNNGSDRHEARLIRVLDGNVNAYRTALSGGPSAVAGLGQEVATAGPLEPGGTATQTVDLAPGTYVIVDFETTPDGSTFAQNGML